jgi:hypothetical protein
MISLADTGASGDFGASSTTGASEMKGPRWSVT